MRVLVVEDEVALAETLRDGLGRAGYAVDTPHDGAEGLFHPAPRAAARPIRRGAPERPAGLTAGDLTHDPAQRRVGRSATTIAVTPREFAMLEFLMRHRGNPVTKRAIIENVWDAHFSGDPHIVEVYIGYLRKKIDHPFGRAAIETVRGTGYRLNPDGGESRARPGCSAAAGAEHPIEGHGHETRRKIISRGSDEPTVNAACGCSGPDRHSPRRPRTVSRIQALTYSSSSKRDLVH
ncbi:DNA-binding response regulator [Krasilnikovia sp. MM14-A1259]|uniref:response regulator transcription factor n=1 Tax=Krasilnikovia sp. MM14-A1259 TaxID=3373539 RepID=UPI0037FB4049